MRTTNDINPAATPCFYCRRCDYALSGLEDHRCPECGLAFNPDDPKTLSRRPTRRRARMLRKLTILLLAGGLLLGYAALTVTVPCGFVYSSYCTECGMIENVDEQHLPLLGITFHTRRFQQSTLLSATLARRGVRQGHIHKWLFSDGGDYGLRHSCAIGNGRYLRDVVNSPEVAAFADGLCLYADPATRERWLSLLLDPLPGRWVTYAVESAAPPRAGFPDAASFGKWWDQNAAQIEQTIRLYTSP